MNQKTEKATRTPHPRLLTVDPYLAPYARQIEERMAYCRRTRERLLNGRDIVSFASGHLYFGLHRREGGWVFREHAPNAAALHLFGEFNDWNRESHPLRSLPGGDWEIEVPGEDAFRDGQRILLQVTTPDGQTFDRIPAYIRGLVHEAGTPRFDGRVTVSRYEWRDGKRALSRPAPLLIYECHVGMAQEDESGVGTYRDFADKVLPRIKADGYNAIQLMAIQEHPYYASFGYQVTNPFAASCWYGEPDDLKYLVDAAHGLGLRVLLDVVHSHSSRNEREGICNFDGSGSLYCEGDHPAWGSKLFAYYRDDVVHYLLSNLRFWMEEYHFDGFRFDGVTSMIYKDHAMGRAFGGYDDYFSGNADYAALAYLSLATELIHAINPNAVAIAEDMSGYPGMCLPLAWGGIGFDFRLNMGVPDLWIKFIKEYRDQDWDMFKLWYELSTRRPQEKTVGYSESHDQALVGDKTIIFRLLDAEMYTGMNRDYHTPTMDRGIALAKLIRFVTLAVACDGYLNFMGNEFGHPEWIDFPREGNGWSYHYARRQWSLADNSLLKYGQLGAFDRDMLALVKKHRVLADRAAQSLWIDQDRKLLAFKRGPLTFLFNFDPERDCASVPCRQLEPGNYRVVFDSDRPEYGGFGRVSEQFTLSWDGEMQGCLPARTAAVLVREEKEK